MSEKAPQLAEKQLNDAETLHRSVADIYKDIAALEPKPVANFVPDNAVEARRQFFAGEVRNPKHTYSKLEALTPAEDGEKIDGYALELSDSLDENSTEFLAYSQYAYRYSATQEMIKTAQDIHSDDKVVAEQAKARFAELNEQLYGAPDELTYRSLLYDVANIPVTEETAHIKEELMALLPESSFAGERFKPSAETIENMKEIAEYLYGGMLEHIPEDQKTFTAEEVATIFREIIADEFGEAAEEWTVQVTKATSINVVASEKTIKIPENRKDISNKALRGLVAHEIGVHMLRSVAGSETDLPILTTGLSDYYDSEEGYGKVMEQAIDGKYVESGVPYYLVAGLMHFDNKDFRGAYDIIYRMKYLESVNAGKPADEKTLEGAQDAAYKAVFRLTRGTDELPWFKDLAYYNGTAKMWKQCEDSAGDYELFMLNFLGKGDPTIDDHRRILLETKSQ